MKIIRCPQCNLADWENVVICKRCRYEFQNVAEESEIPLPAEEILESPYQRLGSELERQDIIEAPVDGSGTHEEPYEPVEPTESKPPVPEEEAPPLPGERSGHGLGETRQIYRQTAYQSQHSNPTRKPKVLMAVISMILGIIGMPLISMFWGVFLAVVLALVFGTTGAIIGGVVVLLFIPSGLILGIVSLVKSKRKPLEFGGKGFAIAGIICSTLGILTLPVIAAIAVPNLLAARRAANEGSAISFMRVLSDGQTKYRENRGGHCGDLSELRNANLINEEVADGQKIGYQFLVLKLPVSGGGCEITATPISTFDGNRSFYYSTEDNVMRADNKNGEMADKNDPPLQMDFEEYPPKIAASDDLKR